MAGTLFYRLFDLAVASATRYYPARWVAGRDLDMGGTAPSSRQMRGWLLLGTEEEFQTWGYWIRGFIICEALSFQDPAAWRWQEPSFRDLFGRLFRPINCPAFIWATPLWLPSGRGIEGQKLKAGDRTLTCHRVGSSGRRLRRVNLEFGLGKPLEIDTRHLAFAPPRDHPNGLELVRTYRERTGIDPGGKPAFHGLEDNLALVAGESKYWLKRGTYADMVPNVAAHSEFHVQRSGGDLGYYTSPVVMLARLERSDSWEGGWVRYVSLRVHPGDGRMLVVTAVRREFRVLMTQYPWLRELLSQTVEQGETHAAPT